MKINTAKLATGIGMEAVNVLAGALLAALIISQFPAVKAWMKAQWA